MSTNISAECPICFERFSGPIFNCERGHSLCDICTTLVDQCPTCRAPMTQSRNFALESILADSAHSSQKELKCSFKECQKKFQNPNGVKSHEKDCNFRDVICTICNSSIPYGDYICHLIQVHNIQESGIDLQIGINLDKIKSTNGEKYIIYNENGENLLVNMIAKDGHFYMWIEHLKSSIFSEDIFEKYLVKFWEDGQTSFSLAIKCSVLEFRKYSTKDLFQNSFSFNLKQLENFQGSGNRITLIAISTDETNLQEILESSKNIGTFGIRLQNMERDTLNDIVPIRKMKAPPPPPPQPPPLPKVVKVEIKAPPPPPPKVKSEMNKLISSIEAGKYDNPRQFSHFWQNSKSFANIFCFSLEKGIIKSKDVKSALISLDRKYFTKNNPYEDRPQQIGYGVTISAPHMHAYGLELLELKKGNNCLDVGSGSGFMTAAMALMVGPTGRVIGIDLKTGLVELAKRNVIKCMPSLINEQELIFIAGDGKNGCEKYAPYDRIHVGASAPIIPDALIHQLKVGGRIVMPIGPVNDFQNFTLIEKAKDGSLTYKKQMGVRFMPLE